MGEVEFGGMGGEGRERGGVGGSGRQGDARGRETWVGGGTVEKQGVGMG